MTYIWRVCVQLRGPGPENVAVGLAALPSLVSLVKRPAADPPSIAELKTALERIAPGTVLILQVTLGFLGLLEGS